MTQLVQPNLSAVGRIGYCLEYAGPKVFGTTYVPNPPFASKAWEETQFKHSAAEPLPNNSAPCWFSFGIDGIDEGHVVIWVPGQGFYSSPWQPNTTHAVLPTIDEVIRIYSNNGQHPMSYLGWSEDILNLRIVKGETMPVSQQKPDALTIQLAFNNGLGRQPSDADLDNYKDKTVEQLMRSILESPEHAAFINKGFKPYTGPEIFVKS